MKTQTRILEHAQRDQRPIPFALGLMVVAGLVLAGRIIL